MWVISKVQCFPGRSYIDPPAHSIGVFVMKPLHSATSGDGGHGLREFSKQIILAAEERLRRSSSPELALAFCTFHDGALVVTGTVSDSSLRQAALALVQGLEGVQSVVNQLIVAPHMPSSRFSQTVKKVARRPLPSFHNGQLGFSLN